MSTFDLNDYFNGGTGGLTVENSSLCQSYPALCGQQGGAVFNPTFDNGGYNPNASRPIVPNVTATGAGIQVQSTTLDKILGSVLSGMAIVKGATAVPTTISGQQSYAVDPYQQAAYLQQMQMQGDGTASGKVENWVKQNTGVVLIGGAIVVAYLMKSPRGR